MPHIRQYGKWWIFGVFEITLFTAVDQHYTHDFKIAKASFLFPMADLLNHDQAYQ